MPLIMLPLVFDATLVVFSSYEIELFDALSNNRSKSGIGGGIFQLSEQYQFYVNDKQFQ